MYATRSPCPAATAPSTYSTATFSRSGTSTSGGVVVGISLMGALCGRSGHSGDGSLPRQPRVPEVQERPRLEPAQLPARRLQRIVVAELDAPHVLVEDRLH